MDPCCAHLDLRTAPTASSFQSRRHVIICPRLHQTAWSGQHARPAPKECACRLTGPDHDCSPALKEHNWLAADPASKARSKEGCMTFEVAREPQTKLELWRSKDTLVPEARMRMAGIFCWAGLQRPGMMWHARLRLAQPGRWSSPSIDCFRKQLFQIRHQARQTVFRQSSNMHFRRSSNMLVRKSQYQDSSA